MLWLAKYGSIPSVYFGPGKMEQAHAVDEHIEIEDLTNAAKIFAHIILNAVGKS
jgi:acetylornithine deacetylase/succinyl-diaminopimelate desuccinylase-like protein